MWRQGPQSVSRLNHKRYVQGILTLEGLRAEVSSGGLMLSWPCSQARLTTQIISKETDLGSLQWGFWTLNITPQIHYS